MMKFDVIADWALNKFCNFSCPYCYVSMKDGREIAYKGIDAQKTINAFNSSGKIWLVHMSGGELTFHRAKYRKKHSPIAEQKEADWNFNPRVRITHRNNCYEEMKRLIICRRTAQRGLLYYGAEDEQVFTFAAASSESRRCITYVAFKLQQPQPASSHQTYVMPAKDRNFAAC